jgi:hypothetical protein
MAAAGCATARKDLGEVQVRTLRPIVSSQRYDYVNFRVQEGRVFISSPYTGTDFDLVALDDGCLRGNAGNAQLHYCPASDKPDADGTRHWRSVGGGRTFFSTLLRDEGRVLEIVAANFRAQIDLGNSPTDDEIRKRPELIAAAFARGLFPASKDEEGTDSLHREWKYTLKPL